MNKKIFNILFIGIIFSSLIATFSFLFLQIEKNVSHIIWDYLLNKFYSYRYLYIFIILVVGSVLLNKIKQNNDAPYTANEILKKLDKNIENRNYHIKEMIISTLLILILGAGVGPEATLLGIIVSMSIWQADKLRYIYKNFNEFSTSSLTDKVNIILNNKKYITYSKNNNQSKNNLIKYLFIFNGIIVFLILSSQLGDHNSIVSLGDGTINIKQFWIIVPLIFYSIIFAIFYKKLDKYLKNIIDKHIKSKSIKVYLGAFFIFLIFIINKNLLFSGQHSMHLVVTFAKEVPFYILIIFSIIKILLLSICINTGWKGGDIFPLLFASFLQGYAISSLFPNIDYLLIIATLSTAFLTTVSSHIIVVLLFISLFFPLKYIVVILLTTILTKGILKILKFKYL